jgi:signal transduction histidine kinase
MTALAAKARELTPGNIVRAPPAPFQEAETIGTTLETVSEELKRRDGLLARHRDNLEAEVARRTSELVAETQRRGRIEDQLRQSQKMEALGKLTGGVAHDFNNMLAIILGALGMMQRRLARGDSDVLRYVDNATDGAQRAANLTQRLLAFSRQSPLAPAVIDANASIRDMSELLRRTLGEEVDLEVVQGGGLWRTSVDAGQLEQAVAGRYDVTVIVDQLYSRLLYSRVDYAHLRARNVNSENVVTINGAVQDGIPEWLSAGRGFRCEGHNRSHGKASGDRITARRRL